jgi:uncharacterized membrane protein
LSRKKFTTIYICVTTFAFLMLIFPIYEFANRATPIVMGLPFSFFWPVLWIVITFIAVVGLYFVDPDNQKKEEL